MPNKVPPNEDTWAWQEIGTPFPPDPMQAPGQNNMIVGLYYKHGRPIHGLTWNDGGVVQCSFAYGKVELSQKRDLGGQIQILQTVGDHRSQGYWYRWIKLKEMSELKNTDTRELVRCGNSMPLFWKSRAEGPLLGYLDMPNKVGWFSHDKKAEQVTDKAILDEMLIIVRELKGGPPGCTCADCPKSPAPVPVTEKVIWNQWNDHRAGDAFPTAAHLAPIKALNRSLKTLPNESPDQFVALWYQQGEPVMGRVWNNGGKIAACFSWGGHCYTEKVGSLQILTALPESIAGFTYSWIDYPQAAKYDPEKEWRPVHVDNRKFDISPAVLIIDGKEILGKVDIRNEKASAGHAGKEILLVGPAVHSCKVLCRKANPGVKLDS